MDCKINVIQYLKPIKVERIFERALKGNVDIEALTEYTSNKLISWTKLDSQDGSSALSTTAVYNFENAKEELYRQLDAWVQSKESKNKLSDIANNTTDEIRDQNLTNAAKILSKVIELSVDLFYEKTRIQNVEYPTNPVINGANLVDFKNISVLLNNSDAMLGYLNTELSKIVTWASFINLSTTKAKSVDLLPQMEIFVKNNITLNNNIIGLKARLWADIVDAVGRRLPGNQLYIKENNEWTLNTDLFKPNSKGLSKYDEIVMALNNKYNDLKRKSTIGENFTTTQSYIKMIILLNFDNFISSNYSNFITVNPSSYGTWGLPNNGQYKYTLNKAASISTTWAPDSHGENDVSEFESGLFRLISNVIEYKDSTGDVVLGSYLDTVRINSIGGILWDIPSNIIFSNKRYEGKVESYNIYDWFEEIANNRTTFKNMLEAIIDDYEKDNNLALVIDFINSVYNFLYNPINGVDGLYKWEQQTKFKESIQLVNVESILFNQLRNVGKATYYVKEHNTKERSRILDTLLIDTKVGEDFDALYSSISTRWTSNKTSMMNHEFWNTHTFNDFLRFLSAFGEIDFSPSTLDKYKKQFSKHSEVFDKHTVDNLKKYFAQETKIYDEDENGSKVWRNLTSEEWVYHVRSNDDLFTGLDLVKLFKSMHISESFNLVTQVSNFDNEKFPSLGIMHLGSAFNSIVNKALKRKISSETSQVLEAMEKFTVLLEVVSGTEAKPFNKLSAEDNMSLGLMNLFYEEIINNDKLIVQPYNLADKSKVLAQVLNYKTLARHKADGIFTSEDAKEFLKKVQFDHYSKLKSTLLNDYKKIAPNVSFKSIQDIDEFLKGKSWESDILPLVEAYNKDPKNANNKLEFTDELHFSRYKGNKLAFNKVLKYHIDVWTNPNSKNYNDFIQQVESNFIQGASKISLDVTSIEIMKRGKKLSNPGKIMEELKSKFGFTDDDFHITYRTKEVTKDVIKVKENGEEHTIKEKVKEVVMVKDKPVVQRAEFKLLDNENHLSEPLKRYLWTRNLAMSTVTNTSTKGSYIHPIKSALTIDVNDKLDFNTIMAEEDERTVAFFKRMVLMGGSINRFKQGGPDGLPTKIQIATIENPVKSVYTYSGLNENQKVFDGGIWVNPFFVSQLIDALPGANLSRVMKPLGMSITDSSISFLKCAFFGINNEMVFTSANSEYSIHELMKKLNNVQFNSNILNKYEINAKGELVDTKNSISDEIEGFLSNLYVPVNGVYTRITSIGLTNTPHEYSVMYENSTEPVIVPINNLFDLWNLFGGSLSSYKRGNEYIQNEASIDLVNFIIRFQAGSGNLEFKSSMVAMLAPREGMKSGMTNVNPLNRLKGENKESLSTMTFSTEFLGIQLDASYDSDEHTVSEITQVLSALSENNTSPEQYNAVYNVIAQVISTSLKDFTDMGDKQLEEITKTFVKNLNKSTTVDNAKTLLDNLEEDLKIPFTDRTLLKIFISSVISNINKEFIRKKIAGAGMILNMSQGAIKIYEDSKGKTYLTQDLLKIFNNSFKNDEILYILNDPKKSEMDKARAKVDYVLNNLETFKSTTYPSIDAVKPMDDIQVVNPETNEIIEEVNLFEIKAYYSFLKKYKDSNYEFRKIYTKTRDLSPSQRSFSYVIQTQNNLLKLKKSFVEQNYPIVEDVTLFKLGISKKEIESIKSNFLSSASGDEITEENFNAFANFYILNSISYKNGFSLDSVKYKFELSETKNLKDALAIPFINELHNYLLNHNENYQKVQTSTINDKVKFELLQDYVEKLSQRNWDVISLGKTFSDYTEGTNYFEKNLVLSDGTFDDLDYGLDTENNLVNLINIFNLVEKDAENIVSKWYNTQFKLDNVNHADISVEFFNKFFKEALKRNNHKHYDVLLSNTHDSNKSLQIIFSDLKSISDYESNLDINPWKEGVYLLDNDGNLITTTKTPYEYRFVAKKLLMSTKKKGNKTFKLDHKGNVTYELDSFKYTNIDGEEDYAIFQTEDKKELAITTKLEIGEFVENSTDYFGIVDIWDSRRVNSEVYESIIKKSSNYNLRGYLRERQKVFDTLVKETNPMKRKELTKVIGRLKNDYFTKIATQMFNSWKLSNYTLSSRIPAQSGQSYMSMKTVGYMHANENSVYVSHWQIFLQGSDFDIDKLYMMKYSMKNGLFVGWSPYFDLSTSGTIKDSLSLPAPDRRTYKHYDKEVKSNPDIDLNDVLDLETVFNFGNRILTITDRSQILNYVYKASENKKYQYIKTSNNEVFNTVRNHNSFDSEEGLNNFKVHQMIKVSRNARNQLSANTPVSFGKLYSLKKKKETNLHLFNPYSMYLQQENNYVGKDVIGIAATGIKSYFALVSYFSNYYKKGEISPLDNAFFMREYTIGNNTRLVKHISGLNLTKKSTDLLKETVLNLLLQNKYKKEDGTLFTPEELTEYVSTMDEVQSPALKLSALLSAATDNAKELLLADINAGIDFASMHVFLIIMGFDEIEVAKYMTSENALLIKNYLKDSFLSKKRSYGINSKLKRLTAKQLGINVEDVTKNLTKELNTSNLDKLENSPVLQNENVAKIFNKKYSSATKLGLVSLIKESNDAKMFTQYIENEVEKWFDKEVNLVNSKPLKKGYTAESRLNEIQKLNHTRMDARDSLLEFAKTLQFEISSEGLESMKNDADSLNKFIDNFRKIYFHSKELAAIGSMLSINQGVKATIEDVYKIARNLSNIVGNQQREFFKDDIKIDKTIVLYNTLEIWDSLDEDKQTSIKSDILELLDVTELPPNFLQITRNMIDADLAESLKEKILEDKPYLTSDYVETVLYNALQEKLITKGIDYVLFAESESYRKTVTDYLNLIKFNFNAADVLNNLPHFREMTQSFQVGNLFLERNLLGYKFITKVLPRLLNIATFNEEITSYNSLRNMRTSGKASNPISLSPDLIERSQDTLYEIILMSWLKELDFNLDFTEYILTNYPKGNITLFENDKSEIKPIILDRANLGDSLKVDLSTEYGWAKFKYLMEIYIIPSIKNANKSNEFLKNYVYKKNKGYNMKRTIKFYQGGSNFEIALAVERGMERIVKNSNNLFEMSAKVPKGSNIKGTIPFIDLLTIYDKMTNLGRYGGNRSTLFFSKNRGENTSLSSDFIRYQSQLEYSNNFISSVLNRITSSKEDSNEMKKIKKQYRESLYLSLFGNSSHGVRKYTVTDASRDEDASLSLEKSIRNEYFKLVESIETSVAVSPSMERKALEVTEAADKIQSSGILESDCK